MMLRKTEEQSCLPTNGLVDDPYLGISDERDVYMLSMAESENGELERL